MVVQKLWGSVVIAGTMCFFHELLQDEAETCVCVCVRSVLLFFVGQPRVAPRLSIQSLALYVSPREFVCLQHMCL